MTIENQLRRIECGSGNGFCYDVDRTLFAGADRLLHGPLLIALDTNVVLALQEYGARLIDGEGIEHPDPAHLGDLNALGTLLDLWFMRDIRFVVLPGARDDQRRAGQPAVLARRERTMTALEEALSFQLQDWEHADQRFDWEQPVTEEARRTLDRIAGDLDRVLVREAYVSGVDVFLTMDKQVLRAASNASPPFPHVWRPATLTDATRRLSVEHLTGGMLDHSGCPYGLIPGPDLGKMGRLLEALS